MSVDYEEGRRLLALLKEQEANDWAPHLGGDPVVQEVRKDWRQWIDANAEALLSLIDKLTEAG